MSASAFIGRYAAAVALLSTVTLAGCVSQSSYDKLKAENDALQQQTASQAQQISAQQAEIAASKAQSARLIGAIKYTVNSDLLFRSGSWEMKPAGKKVIARIAEKLAPTQEHKLTVTGYTDNAPIGPGLAGKGVTSNQMLSEKRANAVMEFLIAQGVKADLVSAQGKGDADPVAPNNTAAGRAKNRRVELSLAN